MILAKQRVALKRFKQNRTAKKILAGCGLRVEHHLHPLQSRRSFLLLRRARYTVSRCIPELPTSAVNKPTVLCAIGLAELPSKSWRYALVNRS